MFVSSYSQRIMRALGWLAIMVLPFQTRLIIDPAMLNGVFFEYGTLSIYVSDIVLIPLMMMYLWVYRHMFTFTGLRAALGEVREYPFWRRIGLFAALIWIVWLFASLSWSSHILLSLQAVHTILGALFLILYIRSEAQATPSMGVLFAVIALIQSTFVLAQVITQHVAPSTWLGIAEQLPAHQGVSVVEVGTERFLRAYGTLPHPNILGGVMFLCFAMITYYGAAFHASSSRLWGMTVGFIAATVGVFFSFSRSAWIAWCIFLGTYAMFEYGHALFQKLVLSRASARSFGSRGKYLHAMLLISVILFSGLAWMFRSEVATRLTWNTRLEQQSADERIAGYQQAWPLIRAHWFRGVGAGNYAWTLYEADETQHSTWYYQPVHNVALLIGAELGLLGAVSLLAALAIACVNRIYLTYHQDAQLAFIQVSCMAGIGVLALFDHYLWSLHAGIFFAAACLGYLLQDRGKPVHT